MARQLGKEPLGGASRWPSEIAAFVPLQTPLPPPRPNRLKLDGELAAVAPMRRPPAGLLRRSCSAGEEWCRPVDWFSIYAFVPPKEAVPIHPSQI